MMEEIGWLIEFSGPLPTYYGVEQDGKMGVTADHMAAVRFARAADAQAVIDAIGWPTEAKPIEHMWYVPRMAPVTHQVEPDIRTLEQRRADAPDAGRYSDDVVRSGLIVGAEPRYHEWDSDDGRIARLDKFTGEVTYRLFPHGGSSGRDAA